MKIVFTAKGSNWESEIDPRFGRAVFLLVFDDETGNLKAFDNTELADQAHGVGPKVVEKIFEMGAGALVTGNGPGNNAAVIMKKSGIKTFVGAEGMTISDAYDAYKKGILKEFYY